ncbi:MAG: prepilin-type N-terminal cleavage/methylation domain-containing protein [Candidatus Magasanikbacteria bacterium]|nr:prepilin-type N-terminal cleavage/methylation domain-containing protein [Candidatus Magasanikbacteria bacterium]
MRDFEIFNSSGFTLLEVLVAMGLFIMIITGVTSFITMTFKSNDIIYTQLSAQKDARSALSGMVKEVRNADSSSIGSYLIDTAASSTLSFYSDINSDTFRERVRYFVSGNLLKKGVMSPSGTPLTYNPANEVVTTVAHDLIPNSQPFQYFDATYNGNGVGFLAQPVNVTDARYIRITIVIDQKPNVAPVPLTASTEVEIRNLKVY